MQKMEVVSRELRDQMELNRHLKEQVRLVPITFLSSLTVMVPFALEEAKSNTAFLFEQVTCKHLQDILFWPAVGVASWKSRESTCPYQTR